jgi:HAD superfamily hydrolase (TIGR01490 family)
MEAQEVKEVQEVEESDTGIAAFFDLDGTLVELPSLEKRFFRMLRYQRLIGARNYFLWLAESARLAPQGIDQIVHANKMYLRGVRIDGKSCGTGCFICLSRKNEEGWEKTGRAEGDRRQARVPVLPFYPEAIELVAWHARRGHAIVLVSGTLEPLAQATAICLLARLGVRGITASIAVCATRLESLDGQWTGRIVGEAMFGEEKARAIKRVAAEANLDLPRCFAYGDSASDRWMLEAVGKPAAVNPSNDLARIARRNEWPVLRWGKEKHFRKSSQRTRKGQSSEETGLAVEAAGAKSGHGT